MLVFLSFSIHNEYIGKSSDTYFCDGNNKIHHFFKLSFLNSSNQFLFPITHNLIDQEISANILTQGPLPIKTQILDNTSHNHASKYLHGPTTLQKLRDFDIISFHRNSQKQDDQTWVREFQAKYLCCIAICWFFYSTPLFLNRLLTSHRLNKSVMH